MSELIITFEDYSFEQLNSLKADLVSYLKNKRVENQEAEKLKRAEEKAEKTAYGKNVAEKGATVTVSYKNGTITGTVIKTTDKTFTIQYGEDENGKPLTQWRHYHQVIEG